jgi:hypothetical protein
VAALPLKRPSDRSALRLLVSDKSGHASADGYRYAREQSGRPARRRAH